MTQQVLVTEYVGTENENFLVFVVKI